MALKTRHLSFIAGLRSGLPTLKRDLGDNWSSFSRVVLLLLDCFDGADDQEKSFFDLLHYVRRMSGQSQYISELILTTKVEECSSWEPAPDGGGTNLITVWPVMRGAPADDEPSVDSASITIFTRALATEIRSITEPPSLGSEIKPRYFNTFFTRKDNKQIVPVTEPLLQQPYYLNVEISPEKQGPGEDDTFVDSAVREAQSGTIPLLVVASSRDFEIKPRIRKIDLPPEGRSTKAVFSVTPLVTDETAILQVEIFYRGHLLQAKRLEAFVVSDAGLEITTNVQSARIVFTTTERFSIDTVNLIPERVLSIDVERDQRDQSVMLRFLDRSNGEAELACYDTTLEPQALGTAVDAVRAKLKATVKGEQRNGQQVQGYEWKKTGSDAMLVDWLPYLANVGRNLYRALLPESQRKSLKDAGEKLQAALRLGTAIQVNPIAGRVTIPWCLLYERPVFIHSGENRICSRYWSDGPECVQCESRSDPAVICPSAFWGYRYAIEQLPCWVGNESPNPLVLLQRISNSKPLLLNLNVWRNFNLWRKHLERLEAAGTITTVLAEDLSTVTNTWNSRSHELDILYFYTHGGTQELEPYLEVSDGRITSNTLESKLGTGTLTHNPLVFLNGCATGDYGPESFVSLIDDFRNAGACGVIGTECAIPEMFAEEFAMKLFPRLFRGERLGEAMLELRREFLIDYKNPLALVYSLYASNEITLANPVNKP